MVYIYMAIMLPAAIKKSAVLHIHGFEGNFYENNFGYVLTDELEKQNTAFLTVNTRNNGRNTDFNTVGGVYE
jgi:predicted alpha/beta-fold hydrolase